MPHLHQLLRETGTPSPSYYHAQLKTNLSSQEETNKYFAKKIIPKAYLAQKTPGNLLEKGSLRPNIFQTPWKIRQNQIPKHRQPPKPKRHGHQKWRGGRQCGRLGRNEFTKALVANEEASTHVWSTAEAAVWLR